MLASEALTTDCGHRTAMRAFACGMERPPRQTVSEWADAHRYLPSKGASEPGRWRTDRVPFIREVMDALSEHNSVRRVVFQKSTQVAGTEAGNNWVGSVVHRMRVPMLVVMPTIELAELWSKQRLAPMIDETPVLRDKISPARSRDSGNTTLLKEWPGGVLKIAGANSAPSLRSMPARYLFADEVDAYPGDLDGEGDPLTLAEARTSTFPDRKMFLCSTPTIKSLSVIDKEYRESDQRHYHVPCPHCSAMQILEWDQLHWPEGDPEKAAYLCIECGTDIHEHAKPVMLAKGQWVAERPERSKDCVGFHINALYTPPGLGLSWGELAALYDRVKMDPVRLKTFENTKLGICTEDPEEKIDWEEVKERAESYALRTIPEGCIVLTCGIDVQKDRWEAMLLGHGPGGKEWVIDYQVLYGDPTEPKDWHVVAEFLEKPITNGRGIPLRPSCTFIDAGNWQDDVVRFCHGYRSERRVCASKGMSTPGGILRGAAKVDYKWHGGVVRHGAKLWRIGPDALKRRLFQLLQFDATRPDVERRRLRFPAGLDDSFYAGLTAEIHDPNKGKWVKIRDRNEPLDCYGLAIAASHHPRLALHNWSDARWERERQMIEPENDLFSAPPVQAQQNVNEARRPVDEKPEHREWVKATQNWMKRR